MARFQHIALAVDNPGEVAEYYKRVFGLRELNRSPADTGDKGVWLTDGYIYFAVLNPDGAGTPLPGRVGLHHFGFVVDDLEKSVEAIEQEGATECYDSTPSNRKYQSPDGICVDLRAAEKRWWDKRVQASGELLTLVPETEQLGNA